MTDRRPLASFEIAQLNVIESGLEAMAAEIEALGSDAWLNNARWRIEQAQQAVANHFEGDGSDA